MNSFLQFLQAIAKKAELIRYLTLCDIKREHASFVLGYLWWILNPLLWMLVYWLFLSVILGYSRQNHMLFIFISIMPWRAFSTALSKSMTSISGKSALIRQVAFPKAVLPIMAVLSETFLMIPGFLLVIAGAWFLGITPTFQLLWLPVVIGVQVFLALACGLFLSIATIYVGDLKKLMQVVMRMWLYLSPALYGLEKVPENLLPYYQLNPMVGIFESYHRLILNQQPPAWSLLGTTLLVSLGVFVIGASVFIKLESKVAKVV